MKHPIIDFPTQLDIQNMKIGDSAVDCFGQMSTVVEISCIREDIHGVMFCCYWTQFGEGNSRISNSRKEGHITRTAGLSRMYDSHSISRMERKMRQQEERCVECASKSECRHQKNSNLLLEGSKKRKNNRAIV